MPSGGVCPNGHGRIVPGVDRETIARVKRRQAVEALPVATQLRPRSWFWRSGGTLFRRFSPRFYIRDWLPTESWMREFRPGLVILGVDVRGYRRWGLFRPVARCVKEEAACGS